MPSNKLPENGFVTSEVESGIGRITFFHPKANAFSTVILEGLRQSVESLSANKACKVILIQSKGQGAFSGGAFFDELKMAKTAKQATKFFGGFSKLLLAMRESPKFIVTGVQGKAVGGAVGIIAASDYVIATSESSVRLSEFAIGLAPFVVAPAIERRIGKGAFGAMAIDTRWRDARWAEARGLYDLVEENMATMNSKLIELTGELISRDPAAAAGLRQALWSDSVNWTKLLPKRAGMSGRRWLKCLNTQRK